MSNVGYTNRTEKKERRQRLLQLAAVVYIASLTQATLNTPWPPYEQIGVKVDGEYRQLNANVLQIENEYYASMRPKQPPLGNEKPVRWLCSDAACSYVELRSVDINPLEPTGRQRGATALSGIVFLLFCPAACKSPPLDAEDTAE
jgi:glutamate--cysteine ligase